MLGGSCQCGKVRYEIRGAPAVMYYCHCGTCRKATGSAYATNIVVATESFVVSAGQTLLKGFQSSPGKFRYFCSDCGSPIYSHGERTKHIVSVRCGTLDGDPGLRPSVHAYVADKAVWDAIHDDLPQKPASFA